MIIDVCMQTSCQNTRQFFLKEKYSLRNGFTLIEIILVMAILVVIAGLTLPSFRSTYNILQLKEESQDMAFLMRYAQSRSITKNVIVRLVLNDDLTQYWLEDENKGAENSAEGSFQRFSGRLGRDFEIKKGIIIEITANTVEFYPDGTIDKRRIFLCDALNKCFTVSTEEQRGHVIVLDGKQGDLHEKE